MPHQSLAAVFARVDPFMRERRCPRGTPSHWPVCAELDAAATWGIEEAGQTQQVSGDQLAAAFFLVMKARSACEAGRLSEAVAIYDDASLD